VKSLLEPLPETLEQWEAEGCPDVFVEVRRELTCVVVGTLETRWHGPATPVAAVRVRAVLPLMGEFGLDDPATRLERAIEAARRARERSLRPCVFCGKPTPPEHGERDTERGFVCHGCMSTHLGVVF